MTLHYWYLFPTAIAVAIIATASGFSGSVLFQPVFYFILKVPLAQSIATGIATETIGMTNGAVTYAMMRDEKTSIDRKALRSVVPFVIAGVVVGIFFFVYAPRPLLRFTVGVVIAAIAIYQIYLAGENKLGARRQRISRCLPSLTIESINFWLGLSRPQRERVWRRCISRSLRSGAAWPH